METSQGNLDDIITRLRQAGTDLERIDAKSAERGLPKSIWAIVSAFSNHDGGLIILGLGEELGFAPAPGFDARRIQDAIAEAFRPRRRADPDGPVTSRPIGTIDITEVDGAPIVVVDVEELPPQAKPCFVTTQGVEAGTYERVGDGARRMSTYGIFLLSTDRGQPRDDSAPVADSSVDDLDPVQVERFIARLGRTRRRSIEDLNSNTDILRRHNVIASDGKSLTVAGLLALGRYPQQFFPQLMISFAAFPGKSKSDVVGDVRMLDRQIIEGPIPVLVDDAVRAVIGNLKIRRVSRGAGAADEPEIPVDAVREAVANALTHRDYSAFALGDQVRVEVYPDRVDVWNPGRIWGGRRVVDLYDGSSRSRNQILASLLTEVPFPDRDETVCENAGSGIPRMTGVLGRMGLPAPRFDAQPTSMTVTLERHGLLSLESGDWLQSIGASELDADWQRTLVLIHRRYPVDDQVLRAQFGMDREDAKSVLRHLVSAGWLRYPASAGNGYRPGQRVTQAERNADSLFHESALEPTPPPPLDRVDQRILASFTHDGELSIHDLAEIIGLSANTLRPRLRVLVEQGAVIATAPPQSKRRRYRRASENRGMP
ncbi:MAG TPA: ATP-binding protein [Microbacteriaceae bacterium]